MSDSTFNFNKNYKKVCYRADRDLLNTELNEVQDISSHERRLILDKMLAQGTIILGLAGTVDGDQVSIDDGVVYLDGCAVNVPGASLNFSSAGEHLIYLDVFSREVTATDDPSLVNPLTGEPTAEREKWIATLQNRDTTNDPLPDGAISHTIVPVYIFNLDTGELRPYVGSSLSGGDIFSEFSSHAGHGGIDRHPAVTSEIAGFMAPDQAASLESVEAALPNKADVSALNSHRASSDHDSRYFTESESDARFAPAGHVGTGGNAHASATITMSGFMGAADKAQLGEHESRLDNIETTLPGKADDADVSLVSDALNTHRSSADHDSRYYTEAESDGRFAPKSHVGTGGSAHSVATTSQAGFMNASDKSQLANHETRISSAEAALPGKADDSDVTAVQNALSAHATSGDHDSRYYTESESDGRYAPVAHVGSAGSAHALSSTSQAGFMAKEISEFLAGFIHWYGTYDYGNDGSGSLRCDLISRDCSMTWRGRCDSNSTHRLTAMLRATSSPITGVFEIYHTTGNVSMVTNDRVALVDPAEHPSTVPGSKIYYVHLYPDSFTSLSIMASGSGEIGFSLSIFPGDNRQICYSLDPNRNGIPVAV